METTNRIIKTDQDGSLLLKTGETFSMFCSSAVVDHFKKSDFENTIGEIFIDLLDNYNWETIAMDFEKTLLKLI